MLYILVDEHSGVLLNIYRRLSSANYRVISNQFGKRSSDNKTYVKLELEDGALPLPQALEGELLNIEGCTDIFYDEPTQAPPAASGGPNGATANVPDVSDIKSQIKKVAQQIIKNFSDIENIVHNFAQQCPKDKSATLLYNLGFNVGSIVYQQEYALGKPLKLELALKRMLSDAIASFGKITCSEHTISIENNIFCSVANPDGHCDFTKGFMTGFLHGSPTTKDVKVENISCRCHGQVSCSFEFR